jgi:hypothetical protein
VEQPCYKCGQVVEEGRPFCPHCGAPLIRVIVAEPVAAASGATGASADVRDSSDFHSSSTVPVLALPVRWSNAFKPSFLAALVALGLMMLGLYPFVAILSGGFLAVLFYRQGRQNLPVTPASGAKLGALAGFLCFCVTAVLSAIGAAIPEVRARMQAQIAENFQRVAAARPPDPQIQQLLDAIKSPEGFVMMLIVGAILLLAISLILGVLGGVVGGKIFQPRDRS